MAWTVKIPIIGAIGVGKTSLLLRYVDDTWTDFSIPNIGMDFKEKNITFRKKLLNVQLWDSAGQERFRTLTTSFYRGGMCSG